MTNVQEIWLPIPGYENIYEISSFSRVRRISRNIKRANIGATELPSFKLKARYLTIQINSAGYARVTLTRNSVSKVHAIHRLVAQVFLKNPNNYPVVNHINGIKNDNRIENLEWCTHKHNLATGFRKATPSRIPESLKGLPAYQNFSIY